MYTRVFLIVKILGSGMKLTLVVCLLAAVTQSQSANKSRRQALRKKARGNSRQARKQLENTARPTTTTTKPPPPPPRPTPKKRITLRPVFNQKPSARDPRGPPRQSAPRLTDTRDRHVTDTRDPRGPPRDPRPSFLRSGNIGVRNEANNLQHCFKCRGLNNSQVVGKSTFWLKWQI